MSLTGLGEISSKTCGRCSETKPVESFSRNVTRKDGRYPYCKVCTATYQKKYFAEHADARKLVTRKNEYKRYGITIEQFDTMLEKQGGKCLVCGTTKCRTGHRFSVDHCHETGRIRGLLCKHCNIAIGHLNDDPYLLRAAADYLERQNRGH